MEICLCFMSLKEEEIWHKKYWIFFFFLIDKYWYLS